MAKTWNSRRGWAVLLTVLLLCLSFSRSLCQARCAAIPGCHAPRPSLHAAGCVMEPMQAPSQSELAATGVPAPIMHCVDAVPATRDDAGTQLEVHAALTVVTVLPATLSAGGRNAAASYGHSVRKSPGTHFVVLRV